MGLWFGITTSKSLPAVPTTPLKLNKKAPRVGAAVVAVRRAGAVRVFNSINQFFFIGQMIVPGSIYWNMGFGFDKGDVEKDDEGVSTMKGLGENMAWLLKKIHG